MRTARPYLALLVAAILFGSTFVVIKSAIATLPPLAFVGWRFLIAAVALFLLGFPGGRAIWFDGITAGLTLFAGFALQTGGLLTTSASKSALITGLYVVITPLLAGAVARTAPRIVSVAGTGMAFVGLGLLTVGDSLGGGAVIGDWMTVGAAIGFAGHIVILARAAPRHALVPFTGVQMATVAVLGLAGSALFEGLPLPAGSDLPALVMTGLGVSAGAFLLQIWAQARVGPTHTAIMLTAEPVAAAVTGALVLGDRLTARGWWGAALIFASIYVVIFTTSDEVASIEAISATP
ncbi:MAG: DMT family transporter [Acidimicrobiia bacterium]|nr:DMT family transporter [Acidimicrobiia bacterium]